MSSILDALEKLESRRTQSGGPEPPHRSRRNITPLLAVAALVAFAAGIALAAVWLRPEPSAPAPVVVAQGPPPPAAPPAASPPATQPPPPAAAPVQAARPIEQPWAEVVMPAPARDVAPPAAPAAATARTPGQERETAEPAAVIAAVAPPAAAPPPPAAPAAAPAPQAAARPAGAPDVRVSFLVYSSAPDRRTVALAIDQGGLVTLHEGESAHGVSVAQILPDGVELSWQGQSFKVPARD